MHIQGPTSVQGNMNLRRMYIGLTTRRLNLQWFCASIFGTTIVLFIVGGLSLKKPHFRIPPLLSLSKYKPANMDSIKPMVHPGRMGQFFKESNSRRRGSLPTKQFAILAEMGVISKWNELEDMYRCFLNPVDNSTRPCLVYCPEHDITVELVMTETPNGFQGKDAAVFGMSPFTLLKSAPRLMRYLSKPTIPASQALVLYSMESPLRVHKWIERISRAKYHIDFTYLPKSDISVPYAYYKPGALVNGFEGTKNHAQGKTGLIAWMGSNCAKEVFWPRMEFIQDLGRHLPLDTYGKCGNLTCLPRLSTKCVNLISTYKFYLAVENSECREYITEKFWESCLLNGVVPIVYGSPKADFEKLAPPNSYIHVSDFESVKELADYIIKVDQSDELYNSYFEWRKLGSVIVTYPKMQPNYFCNILPLLKKTAEAKFVHESSWYNSCRGNITRRFNISQVPALKDWEPWKLGINDYTNGY
ncbi:alpha-(1,3)-fucosyltransferase 4-like isoform X1 [Asterias amurensis]|uniref:alpha-(1,3)-fucosyltransferase 4-like isoform X1 n=2 Tax=Asterias amurensis TaxID=7602 RepID=UPI003AB14DCD